MRGRDLPSMIAICGVLINIGSRCVYDDHTTPIKNLRIEQYELTKTSHKRGKGERDCN
jgi:hypothetical protein